MEGDITTGANVTLTKTGAGTLTVEGKVTSDSLTVSEGTLALDGDTDLKDVAVNDGSTLTLAKDTTVTSLTAGNTTDASTVSSKVTAAGSLAATTLTASDGASVTLTASDTTDDESVSQALTATTVTLSDKASLSATTADATIGTLAMTTASTASVASLSSDTSVSVDASELTVADSIKATEVTLTGSTLAASDATAEIGTLSLAQSAEASVASLTSDTAVTVDNSTLTVAGEAEVADLTLSNDANLSVADSLTVKGEATLNSGTLSVSSSSDEGTASIALAEGASLTVNEGASVDGDVDVTLADSSTLDVTTTETSVSSLNGTGTLAASGGTLKINGSDSTSEFTGTLSGTGTVSVEGGSMTLAADGGDDFLLYVKNADLTLTATATEDSTEVDDSSEADTTGVTAQRARAVRIVRAEITDPGSTDANIPTYKGAVVDTNGKLILGKEVISTVTGSALRAASTTSSTLLSLGDSGLTVKNGGTISLTMNVNSLDELIAQDPLVVSTGAISLADGAIVELTNEGSIGSADQKTFRAVLMSSDTSATVGDVVLDDKILNSIYTTTLLAEGNNVVLKGVLIEDNVFSADTLGTSLPVNATAGANLLWNARFDLAQGSVLRDVYSAVLDMQDAGDTAGVNKTLAAVAGSTVNATGTAQRDALRDQMSAVRNRALLMGANGSELGHHFWIEGTGSYSNLHTQGDKGGYKLTSWGGTVGADTDVNTKLSLGLALTANYGDLSSHAAERATGDLDSVYVNLFGRYHSNAWGHTLVLTGTNTEAKLDRTVDYGTGYYKTHGQTHGYGLGAAYELTYDVALNDKGTSLLQPLFDASVVSTKLQGYQETGAGNASLHVGKQEWTTATLALGARWSGSFGAETLGKTLFGDLRATVSQDFGDKQGKTAVALPDQLGFTQNVYGAKVGATAVQISGGLSTQIGNNGTIYANAGADIRNGENAVSGTIGYRYSF
jgi:hypothetical protein